MGESRLREIQQLTQRHTAIKRQVPWSQCRSAWLQWQSSLQHWTRNHLDRDTILVGRLLLCVCFYFLLIISQVNTCVCVCAHVVTQLCPTLCDPMDCSLVVILSIGFFRWEYWSGLPFPSRGNLPDPGIEPESPVSPALQVYYYRLSHVNIISL